MARKFVLTIDLDIPEMQTHSDLARELRSVSSAVEMAPIIYCPPKGDVIAPNGNKIGSFGIREV